MYTKVERTVTFRLGISASPRDQLQLDIQIELTPHVCFIQFPHPCVVQNGGGLWSQRDNFTCTHSVGRKTFLYQLRSQWSVPAVYSTTDSLKITVEWFVVLCFQPDCKRVSHKFTLKFYFRFIKICHAILINRATGNVNSIKRIFLNNQVIGSKA